VAPRRADSPTSSAAADAPPQAASALAMCRAPFRSADEVNAVVIARSDLVARGVIELGGNRISGPVLLVNNTGHGDADQSGAGPEIERTTPAMARDEPSPPASPRPAETDNALAICGSAIARTRCDRMLPIWQRPDRCGLRSGPKDRRCRHEGCHPQRPRRCSAWVTAWDQSGHPRRTARRRRRSPKLAWTSQGLPLRLVGQHDDAIADLVHLGQVEVCGRDPGQERLPGPGDERVHPQVQLVQLPAFQKGPAE